MVTARASHQRLALTGNALLLAVDAPNSIKPRNSLERMSAHQLAVLHRLGMKFASNAEKLLGQIDLGISGWRPASEMQAASVEAARLGNAAVRAFAGYNDGWQALDRTRRGASRPSPWFTRTSLWDGKRVPTATSCSPDCPGIPVGPTEAVGHLGDVRSSLTRADACPALSRSGARVRVPALPFGGAPAAWSGSRNGWTHGRLIQKASHKTTALAPRGRLASIGLSQAFSSGSKRSDRRAGYTVSVQVLS